MKKLLNLFKCENKKEVLSISLAPKVITEESEKEKIKPYLDALIKAVNTKDVNNIAITGSYGSGKSTILKTFQKLEKENDIVVIEGAGSPAEINLNQNDIVNMGMAEMADAPVLLIADIDRGGVFAQLYGTVMLLPEKDRKRIKGMIINKFRGDKSLLDPGIKMIEDLVKIPVIATIPYMHLELADEDSLIDDDKKCNTQAQSDAELEKELDKLAALIEENSDMDFIFKTVFTKM